MTTTGRSAESRRVRRGPAQWLLGLLLVLAIGASIAMIFTDSQSIAGSLAVIAALWAAVIGAILVTKFRRQADSAESKARDLRLVYELQLEREITARRQYELGVETQIRKEVRAETNEELGELKAQVEALRASLELLVGGELPDQRVALLTERRRELDRARTGPGGSSRPADTFAPSAPAYDDAVHDDGAVAERDFADTAPDVPAEQVPVAEPHSMTEVIPVVTDDDASREDARDHGAGPRAATSRHGSTVGDSSTSVPASAHRSGEADVPAFVDETPTDEWAVAPAEVVAEPVEEPTPEEPIATATAPSPHGGGRHGRPAGAAADTATSPETQSQAEPAATSGPARAVDRHRKPDPEPGAHQAGRSVSELIDQLRAGSAGGRRRRRED